LVVPGEASEGPGGLVRRCEFSADHFSAWADFQDVSRREISRGERVVLRGIVAQLIDVLERRRGSRLVATQPLTRSGFAGLRVILKGADGTLTIDIYVAERRIYQIGVGVAPHPIAAARRDARLYLDSFELLPS
jgi:hypothetical protein